MSMADERGELIETDFGKQTEDKSRLSRRQSEASEKNGKPRRSTAAGMTLRIVRRCIVPLIMIVMLAAGLYIGYTVIGNGPAEDVFHWSTWQHLYDLVFGES
ncbi:DNA-directed RNA polymerase subunit beta [Paenibacillus thailandensis]|uniref:DNA-directed RNA polymerase subunit beta n=1 Tax=Paenibacillus thailandensis TaxID=393250 RepID=A0ABW5R4E3_9BACL